MRRLAEAAGKGKALCCLRACGMLLTCQAALEREREGLEEDEEAEERGAVGWEDAGPTFPGSCGVCEAALDARSGAQHSGAQRSAAQRT